MQTGRAECGAAPTAALTLKEQDQPIPVETMAVVVHAGLETVVALSIARQRCASHRSGWENADLW